LTHPVILFQHPIQSTILYILLAPIKSKKRTASDDDEEYEEVYVSKKQRMMQRLQKENEKEIKKAKERQNKKMLNVWGQGTFLSSFCFSFTDLSQIRFLLFLGHLIFFRVLKKILNSDNSIISSIL